MNGTDQPREAMAGAVAKKLKPYPRMKDSGVEWLGEVPAHWGVRRLKWLCSRSALYGANVASASYTATGVRFLRTTDITEEGQLRPTGVFLPEELVHDYLLIDGDVLISRSGTIGRSFLYNAELHGPCAYAGYLVRFVPASDCVLPRYVFLYTKTQAFTGFLKVMAISSTIENVNGEKYANAVVPLPPLPEQTAIVRYLDYVDRRVRRLTRAKRKLVALLKEQKQAIIHRAVTRGLDPNAPMKDSGVEWLGEVPAHWEIKKLRHLLRSVVTRNQPDLPLLSVVREQGVILRDLSNRDENHNYVPDDLSDYKVVQQGQFAMNKMKAWQGSYGVSKFNGLVSPAYFVFALHGVDGDFFHKAIRSEAYVPSFNKASDGVRIGQWDLSKARMREISVAVPTAPEEQTAIAAYLDKAAADIDAAIARADREVELLDEYRTRLIADVVTGNLDVREAAAALPEVDPLAAEAETDEAGLDETLTEADNIDASRETAAM